MKPESIHKILIANRSEIALRVQGAAGLLHIPAVAIYTKKESESSWIRRFQESYSLGDGKLSDTYLNISAIIALAKKAGADAIHPGYGFLAENYIFARACEENHIRFIGPPSSILKLMGDKLTAHDFVSRLGIPVIEKIIDTPNEIRKLKHSIEYPVLVKAAAGGGGKGMRLVRSHNELTDVLEIAANEAYQYFADERVYIEKYLHAPRHIEVQIIGDVHGHIIHLFERECSIQRRHQKIIEETRAISLPVLVRNKIIDAALIIARSVNYVNAGTIEFLLDDSGDFFFLEMNPRIQVEHGITEMITGIDLVKEQIRVAEGYPLTFSQLDVRRKGHAIEARIYAEDPEQDLLPSPGKIHYFGLPDTKNVRMETSVTSGDTIYADFDPLIAKIIAHGTNREDAIQQLEGALEQTVITGVRHNIPLISAILADNDYHLNAVSTTYLQERSELFKSQISSRKENVEISDLILAGTAISLFSPKRGQNSLWQTLGYWRIVPRIGFRYKDDRYEVEYRLTGSDSAVIWFTNKKYILTGIRIDDYRVTCNYQKKSIHFYFVPETNGVIELAREGLVFELRRSDRLDSFDYHHFEEETAVEQGIVRSPLPGKVNRILVKVNEIVNKGDNLITIESMKLENGILAPIKGIVQEILISEGEQVKHHDPLIQLKHLQ